MRTVKSVPEKASVAVVGSGPAGLFAAENLLSNGFPVSLYDRKPAPGAKFLVAGSSGGLNITNGLPPAEFAARYGANRDRFARYLSDFSPDDLVRWLSSLGLGTRRGSGGKIFPEGADAPAILSRWVDRLRASPDFSFHPGHRLVGLGAGRALTFETDSGSFVVKPDAAILALGGASWPATGSDGAWREALSSLGVEIAPFVPANCGFEADWGETLRARLDHVPLKNARVSLASGGATSARGELTLTPYGLEGGPIYALGPAIRERLSQDGSCTITLDLAPDLSREAVVARLAGGPGKESLSNFFRKRLALSGSTFALLRFAAERARLGEDAPGTGDPASLLRDPESAAALVKALPVVLLRPRPIEEAISTAGGVSFAGLDDELMLRALPGVFCAGEMLDWEAPTGGFLLQGCFSTGYRAAKGVAAWLDARGENATERG
jgi:uncharacterized flavoprotein (TIGR03862 family)